MSLRGIVLCLLGVTASCATAMAAKTKPSPPLLEEFLTTEPGYVQGKGEVEFSCAFDWRRPAESRGVPVLLELGEEVEPGLDAAAALPRGDLRFTLEANLRQAARRTSGPAAVGEEEDLWVVLTPGLFCRSGPEFECGIGVPLGLTAAAPDRGVVGRVTFELEF